jgi:hypothetical protein
MKESLYARAMRHCAHSNDLFVYAHSLPNGKTVISASRTEPFPKGYSEAPRTVCVRQVQTPEMRAAQQASIAILEQRVAGYEAPTDKRIWPEPQVTHPAQRTVAA